MLVLKLLDAIQKRLSKVRRLLLANARNIQKLLKAMGTAAAHATKGRIVAHHVGRPIALAGKVRAQLAQALEQLDVIAHARTSIQGGFLA